jgi:hypothetical protein
MAMGQDPGQEKLRKIRALEAQTSNNIILFNDKTY